jgi:signal transduction histidine kinase
VTRRLLASYLTITALVLALLVIPLGLTFAGREQDRLATDLERDATVLGSFSEDALERGADTDLQEAAEEYAEHTGARVVIVDADGVSVADSDAPSGGPRDFSTRPELATALEGERTDGVRHSETLGSDLMYVAIPVSSGGVVHGAVRISYPTSEIDRRVRDNWIRLGLLSLGVLALVALVGVALARSVTRPVTRLKRATAALASGDLGERVPVDRGPPELRSLGRSFNVMAARLQELMRVQRAFVADASHQLRTPLTALRLRLENLEASSDAPRSDDLDAAIAETARLSRLVDGLLLLARGEGDRPSCERADLAEVAAERQRIWEPLASERQVELRFAATGATSALAVPGSAEQMLDNLIDNALEVSPAGSTIEVRVVGGDEKAELHVIDQGPGLDADARRRAFDRFWRAADSSPGGSGLGLAVVRQLATSCDGEAELLAGDDAGVDAVVRLPSSDGAGPP